MCTHVPKTWHTDKCYGSIKNASGQEDDTILAAWKFQGESDQQMEAGQMGDSEQWESRNHPRTDWETRKRTAMAPRSHGQQCGRVWSGPRCSSSEFYEERPQKFERNKV